jgi:hypothetical protein
MYDLLLTDGTSLHRWVILVELNRPLVPPIHGAYEPLPAVALPGARTSIFAFLSRAACVTLQTVTVAPVSNRGF